VGSVALSERYRRAIAFICGTEAKVVDGAVAIGHGLHRIWQEVLRARESETLQQRWVKALHACPIVAILRGLEPHDAVPIGRALVEAGVRIIEVPLNSPKPFLSISSLVAMAPADVVIGAGTVLTTQQVSQVAEAGGKLIVSPNIEESVVRRSKELGLLSLPGCATPTEAFAALRFGADGVKAFPGEDIPPKIVKAWRAVLPKDTLLIPTGGVTVENMSTYWDAGVNGFGIGSNIFKPGETPASIKEKAEKFVEEGRNLVDQRASKRLKVA
jgi:2-dehydro-3-deoxyphosphogalactonate aldolase